jgi:transposase
LIGKRWSAVYKRLVSELAVELGNDAKSYREFSVSQSTFYQWRKTFRKEGAAGLIPKKPITKSHPRQPSPDAVQKVIELRKTYHLGTERITWYLERYHGIHTSCSTVFRTLGRLGISRLPKSADRRPIHTRRYSKEVPGHDVQVDVKFVSLKTAEGKSIR